MPSLLEFVMQHNNPRMAGLLGMGGGGMEMQTPPMAPPPPMSPPPGAGAPVEGEGEGGSRLQSILQGLQQSLTGAPPPDPNLTPEQNKNIRRRTAVMSGLATLAAEGRGVQRMAQGALVGHQVGIEARDRALEAAAQADLASRRAAVGAMLDRPEGLTREDVDRAYALAVAQGDMEAQDRLIKFKDTFPEPPKDAPPQVTTLPDGTLAVFDPNQSMFFAPDGSPIMDMSHMVTGPEDKLQIVEGRDPVTGMPSYAVINLNASRAQIVDGITPEPSGGDVSIDPNRAEIAVDAVNGRRNFTIVENYLANSIQDNPDHPLRGFRVERERYLKTGVFTIPLAQRQRLDADTQEFLQAMDGFLLAEANRIAGVRGVSSSEARDAVWRTFGFEEGDLAGNILNTIDELRVKVLGMEMAAGEYVDLLRDASAVESAALRARISQPEEEEDEEDDSPAASLRRFGGRR